MYIENNILRWQLLLLYVMYYGKDTDLSGKSKLPIEMLITYVRGNQWTFDMQPVGICIQKLSDQGIHMEPHISYY